MFQTFMLRPPKPLTGFYMKNFHTQLLLEANSNLEVKVHQGAKLQIFPPLMEMQSFDLQEVRFDSYISIY